MTQKSGGLTCTQGCWLLALLGGVIVFALLKFGADKSFVRAFFFGGVLVLIGGFLLSRIFCKPVVSSGEVSIPSVAPLAAAPEPKVQNASLAEPAPAAATPVSSAASPATDDMTTSVSAPAAASAAEAAAKPNAAPKPKAVAKPKAAPKATMAPSEKAAPVAKAAAAKAPKAVAAPKPTAKPVAADGKPELLSAARDGGPDDLKMIKGVGPKLEGELHKMGVFHFDQVAAWRKKEVEWMDDNLEGVRGRVSRDEWVKQAKVLAKGGTTEFASRVKKGDVY